MGMLRKPIRFLIAVCDSAAPFRRFSGCETDNTVVFLKAILLSAIILTTIPVLCIHQRMKGED